MVDERQTTELMALPDWVVEEARKSEFDSIADLSAEVKRVQNAQVGDYGYDTERVFQLIDGHQELIGKALSNEVDAVAALTLIDQVHDSYFSQRLPELTTLIALQNQERLMALAGSENEGVQRALAEVAYNLYFDPDSSDSGSEGLLLGSEIFDALVDGVGYTTTISLLIERFGDDEFRTEGFERRQNEELYDFLGLMGRYRMRIEEMIQTGNGEEQVIAVASVMAVEGILNTLPNEEMHGYDDLLHLASNTLTAHPKVAEAGAYLIKLFPRSHEKYLNMVTTFGNPNILGGGAVGVADRLMDIEMEESERVNLISTLVTSVNQTEVGIGTMMFSRWLQKFGMKSWSGEIFQRWLKGTRTHKRLDDGNYEPLTDAEFRYERQELMITNMRVMSHMEKVRPGSVAALNTVFGIFHFGRYPQEVLLRQYENMDKRMPYVLAVFAGEDWNGVFYKTRNLVEGMNKQLNPDDVLGTEKEIGIRIFEFSPVRPVARLMFDCYRRYGSAEAGWMNAHGNIEGVHFYTDIQARVWKLGELDVTQLVKFNRVIPLVKRGGDMVVQACSTGKIMDNVTPFARAIAKLFGLRVQAPEEDTSLKQLAVLRDTDRNIKLNAQFNKGRTMYFDARGSTYQELFI